MLRKIIKIIFNKKLFHIIMELSQILEYTLVILMFSIDKKIFINYLLKIQKKFYLDVDKQVQILLKNHNILNLPQ